MQKSNPFSLLLAMAFILLFSSCGETASHELQNTSAKVGVNSKYAKIDELLNNYTASGKFVGSALVAQEGEIILKKGYGMANMEWDMPNQPNTKFRIASLTKQFTAMLILQLVADEKLDLHTPISAYLPDYPKENADRITIHHLLTHTSGTPEFDVFLNYRDIEKKRYSPTQLMDMFSGQPLDFKPGLKYAYSNTGYVVLGVIIEKMMGLSYADALQTNIFDPLGMNNSGYDLHYTIIKNRAAGYSPGYGRGNYVNVNFVDMSVPYSAGSIYSTVEDLYLWDQALYTEKLVPKEFRDLLFEKHIPATRNRSYGYGWFVGRFRAGETKKYVSAVSHGGGINGFRTNIIRFPDTKSLIVLLSNAERSELYDIKVAINGILNNQPYDKHKSLAYSTADMITEQGLNKGLSFFSEMKNNTEYYLNLEELNYVGYEFLWDEKFKEAEAIFELNVKEHPNHFGVYDSYGEVLLAIGDTVGAIENYQISVQLNPNNRGGVAILESLGVDG